MGACYNIPVAAPMPRMRFCSRSCRCACPAQIVTPNMRLTRPLYRRMAGTFSVPRAIMSGFRNMSPSQNRLKQLQRPKLHCNLQLWRKRTAKRTPRGLPIQRMQRPFRHRTSRHGPFRAMRWKSCAKKQSSKPVGAQMRWQCPKTQATRPSQIQRSGWGLTHRGRSDSRPVHRTRFQPLRKSCSHQRQVRGRSQHRNTHRHQHLHRRRQDAAERASFSRSSSCRSSSICSLRASLSPYLKLNSLLQDMLAPSMRYGSRFSVF